MSLSPDGRFLAYTSDDSGRTEVYVSRFPEMSARVAASAGGGQRPLRRADGRELYFVGAGSRLMAATVTTTASSFSMTPATSVFDVPLFGGLYAPAADGERFLIAMPAPSTDVVPMELQLNPLVPSAGVPATRTLRRWVELSLFCKRPLLHRGTEGGWQR